ncbi:DUF4190 domain-containing protein [Streptomyces sp. APSN-46.1]|uniref:DUF4190 domain-containing protein n=1 Tax=Streptomyces sp. APSN-46.1 TaxID=2929049 RepID=UPI001FB48AA1|nr:DUF4190 domain-containing protein [Streptomyces sp. APSN-46.1]MCJ1678809.1 DUF4190 domain-containing protein [Streptomyces sp. APSN-46.1]
MTPNRTVSTTSTWAAETAPYSTSTRPRASGGANGPAGAAMALGVIGLSTSIVFIGGLFGVLGLILGSVALKKSGRTGTGRTKAVTGVVTSVLAIVVAVLAGFFFVWYANQTQECYRLDSFRQYTECVHRQLAGN